MPAHSTIRHERQLPQLSDDQLRRFEVERGWRDIVCTPGMRYGDADWWRDAVMQADESGRGLLAWNKRRKRWRLSARGRERLGLAKE